MTIYESGETLMRRLGIKKPQHPEDTPKTTNDTKQHTPEQEKAETEAALSALFVKLTQAGTNGKANNTLLSRSNNLEPPISQDIWPSKKRDRDSIF